MVTEDFQAGCVCNAHDHVRIESDGAGERLLISVKEMTPWGDRPSGVVITRKSAVGMRDWLNQFLMEGL